MPGLSERLGHPRDQGTKEGTHAVNVSNEQSPHSPLSARRFDRVARFPSRINTVVTARSAFVTQPSSRGHLAKEAGQTPKPRCPSARRDTRRETRVRISRIRPTHDRLVGRSRCAICTETNRRAACMIRRHTAAQRTVSVPISPDQVSATREILVASSNRLECCRRPAFATALTCPSEDLAGHAVRKSWHRSLLVLRDARTGMPSFGSRFATSPALKNPHRCRRGSFVYSIRCHRPVNRPTLQESQSLPISSEAVIQASRSDRSLRRTRPATESCWYNDANDGRVGSEGIRAIDGGGIQGGKRPENRPDVPGHGHC